MAATNLKHIGPLRNPGDRYLTVGTRLTGTGAIADGDSLITNVKRYPVGTEYFDLTNRIQYVRIAAAGVIGDWCKTVAFTVHS